MSTFILAMLLHPACQVKAQEEIDTVIGSERLPEFGDRSSLPYVEAVLQEAERWHVAVPLGVPHRSLEDDIYMGMFIPKGSLVIANIRGMNLDERVYTDAASFNPSRYLPKPEGNEEPYPSETFGFGRRICPGRYLADASLWIACVSILATFTISKSIDKDGEEITPDATFVSGLTSKPSPYQCRMIPRSERARSLVNGDMSNDSY